MSDGSARAIWYIGARGDPRWSLKAKLAGLDALREGDPLFLGETQRCHGEVLRVPDQVLVADPRDLDAGRVSAAAALDPRRFAKVVDHRSVCLPALIPGSPSL